MYLEPRWVSCFPHRKYVGLAGSKALGETSNWEAAGKVDSTQTGPVLLCSVSMRLFITTEDTRETKARENEPNH